MKAVIVGATGLVGSILTQKIVDDSRFSEVLLVSRRPLEIQNAKLKKIIIQDLSQIKSESSKLKGDLYFCCLGTTIKNASSQENFRKVDYDAVLDFAKIAKSYDAKSFVLISAMGANSTSSIFYNRVKGEIEEALTKLQLKSLSIFRPGLLIGERSTPRAGEKVATVIIQLLSPLLPNRMQKMIATEADQLAVRMIEVGLLAQPGIQIIQSVDIGK